MVASRASHSAQVSARRPRPGSRALTRNILLTGGALASLSLASVMTLFGGGGLSADGDTGFGASAHHAARRNGLAVALAEPATPAIVKRDPHVAIATPEIKKPVTVAARADKKHEGTSTVAKSSAPRAAAKAPARDTGKMTAMQLASAEAVPFPIAEAETPQPTEPERAEPRERVALAFATDFSDPETTGSLGKAATERAPAATKPALAAPPPVAAKIAAVIPAKPAVRAKPARPLTPHEKLWGQNNGGVQLASLTPPDTMRAIRSDSSPRLPTAPYDLETAVYVIEHRRVYMPDGSSLEAHSGLGGYMDNPRFANLRMRGVTPPHVYDLKMREALFHGVEAIRLTPLGGEEAIHGRDGLLAHTYMLGPSGQSNGCVSFKDYAAFLHAFKAGMITRLAVIARLD